MNKKIINKIITNIYNDLKLKFDDICDVYDQNEIFYDEIMKFHNISELNQKDFDLMNLCMEAYILKYNK